MTEKIADAELHIPKLGPVMRGVARLTAMAPILGEPAAPPASASLRANPFTRGATEMLTILSQAAGTPPTTELGANAENLTEGLGPNRI